MEHQNNRVRNIGGKMHLSWKGDDIPITVDEAESIVNSHQDLVQFPLEYLAGDALDWALATLLGYNPFPVWETVDAKMIAPGVVSNPYERISVIARNIKKSTITNTFRPSEDLFQSSELIDQYRICTEIAGDGWHAIVNDCFAPQTYKLATLGKTRVEASLRALAVHLGNSNIGIPLELVDAPYRLKILRGNAA